MSGRACRSSFVFLTVFPLVQAAPPTPRPRPRWGRPSRDDVTRQLRLSAMCAISQSHRVLGSSQNRSCGVHHIFPSLSDSLMPCHALSICSPDIRTTFPSIGPVVMSDWLMVLGSSTVRRVNKANFPANANRVRNPVYPTRSPQFGPSDIR